MAPSRNRKPTATIQKKESRQLGPDARAMAGAAAAECEVNVFTTIVGKVYLFSHECRDVSTQTCLGTGASNDACIQCHAQGRPLATPLAGKYYDWPVGY